MNPKQKERLKDFVYVRFDGNGTTPYLTYEECDVIAEIVEKVLKEGEEKGLEYHSGEGCVCSGGKIVHRTDAPCFHTPSSAKVELPEKIPEKINETLALNYLTLRNKINELIDYLSAQTSPE